MNPQELNYARRKENRMNELEFIIAFVFILLILVSTFIIISKYQIPTLQRQSKTLTCLDNGYFDYDEDKDVCWDLGHYNVDNYECVKEGKCKGRHND